MENQKRPIYGIELISLMEIELSDVVGELQGFRKMPKSDVDKDETKESQDR